MVVWCAFRVEGRKAYTGVRHYLDLHPSYCDIPDAPFSDKQEQKRGIVHHCFPCKPQPLLSQDPPRFFRATSRENLLHVKHLSYSEFQIHQPVLNLVGRQQMFCQGPFQL